MSPERPLVAASDWDSVLALRESAAVGIAAATWRSIGEADDPPVPAPDGIHAYVEEYVDGLGERRDRHWRRAAVGSALFCLASTARPPARASAVTSVPSSAP